MDYALMWIPRSGLFWVNGELVDGEYRRVQWDRKLQVFKSYARAETAKKRVLEKFPDAKGELIILGCEIEEKQ